MYERFANRTEAGLQLARRLVALKLKAPIVVLALPRGGVPVAAEVARALKAPLDLVMVRKIGAPGQPELAVAAVVDGASPQIIVDERISSLVGAGRAFIEASAAEQLLEIARRRQAYLRGRPTVPIRGATAIVVDDGVATGTTMRAALAAVRLGKPARLLLAVPVASNEALAALQAEVDQIVCLMQPRSFHAVGEHYDDFHQVSDAEVIAALDAAQAPAAGNG